MEERRRRLRSLRHAPAELSEPVGALEKTVLIAVPLEAAEDSTEGVLKDIRVDFLVSVDGFLEDLGHVLGHLSLVGEIDPGRLERFVFVDGELVETLAELILVEGGKDEVALALLAGTTGTADTVDVRVAIPGKANLDDVAHVGEVHTASGNVGREQDARLGEAEVVGGPGALCLGELGVDLVGASTAQRGVALEAPSKLVEDGRSQRDLGGGVEVDDCLERTTALRAGLLSLAEDKLIQNGSDVLETGRVDDLLGDTLVRGGLVLIDAPGEVEAGLQGTADKVDDLAGDRGREHESLAGNLLRIGQVLLDLINFAGEAIVHKAIGLVHDQSTQLGGLDSRVRVREDIKQAAGSTDEQVTALALRLPQHHVLLGSSHGDLDNNAGARHHLLGLGGDLLSKLAGGRDDNGADIVGLRALVAAGAVSKVRLLCEDALDRGNQEAESLAGTRLCLGDAGAVLAVFMGQGTGQVLTCRRHSGPR